MRLLAVGATLWIVAILAPRDVAAHQSIPAHPRALQFETSSVQLPSAEGRRISLASGPILYLAADRTLPLVDISLALRLGSFADPVDRAGLASLTGALLTRAGSTALEADLLDEKADELGADLDSSAGATRAGISLSAPSWSLTKALEVFFEVLSKPRFQRDRLASSKSNLLESMTRRNENALEILQREWGWLMVGDQHFSTQPLTPARLQAIAREDLVDFHCRHYRPERMILAISGDFEPDIMVRELESHFDRWPSDECQPAPVTWPPSAPGPGAAPGLYHYEADVPQAKVMLGHRLPDLLDWHHPDRAALAVLGEILGGAEAISRIGGRLRTAEALVYRASAIIDPGELWPGEVQIFFETRGDRAARAIDLALAEVDRLRTTLVHQQELEVARQSLIARLRLAFDTAEEIAGYFAEDELLGRPHDFWQRHLESLSGVDAPAVLAAARRYLLPEAMVVLIVGRWSEIGGEATAGSSPLEQKLGGAATRLPVRDPLTLEPRTSYRQDTQSR